MVSLSMLMKSGEIFPWFLDRKKLCLSGKQLFRNLKRLFVGLIHKTFVMGIAEDAFNIWVLQGVWAHLLSLSIYEIGTSELK